MAGATQWYVRTLFAGSSALLQRQQLAVVTHQGDGLVSNFLREDAALWFPDGVADGAHINEPGPVQAERSLGIEDLADGLIQTVAADLAALDGPHHRIERSFKVGWDDDHVVPSFESF